MPLITRHTHEQTRAMDGYWVWGFYGILSTL